MIDPPLPPDERPEDRDMALAGEYVLRLLSREEEAACAEREARDPAFAALVAAWRADFETLDDSYPAVAPPRALGRRVMERVFGKRRSVLGRLWASAGLWRSVAGVAAAAALLVWLGPVTPPELAPEATPRLVSAIAPAAPAGDIAFLAVFEPQAATLSLNRTSGAVPPGRSLELWLVEEGAPPVSLGVLPETPLARVPLPRELAARIGPGSTLAVSEEAPGGSTTGAPGPVVAAGPVSEI